MKARFIGKQAGANWEDWKNSLHYVDYAVAALIVIGAVWLFVRARRRRSADRDRTGGGRDRAGGRGGSPRRYRFDSPYWGH